MDQVHVGNEVGGGLVVEDHSLLVCLAGSWALEYELTARVGDELQVAEEEDSACSKGLDRLKAARRVSQRKDLTWVSVLKLLKDPASRSWFQPVQPVHACH